MLLGSVEFEVRCRELKGGKEEKGLLCWWWSRKARWWGISSREPEGFTGYVCNWERLTWPEGSLVGGVQVNVEVQ